MKLPLRARADSLDDRRILPLINVVFLLLVFFMLFGALSRPALDSIEPPRSDHRVPASVAEQTLRLTADGRLLLAAEELPPERCVARLRAWQRAHPQVVLQLLADRAVPAVTVVELLETLRAAGLDRIKLLAVATAP